jgi:hypothetical protein
MKTRPDAVATGPPKPGTPMSPSSSCEPGARSRVEPSGTSQSTWPVLMSIACSRPQGGGLQGRPKGESTTSRFMPYGAPVWGEISLSISAWRDAFTLSAGIRVTRCRALEVFT